MADLKQSGTSVKRTHIREEVLSYNHGTVVNVHTSKFKHIYLLNNTGPLTTAAPFIFM